MSETSCTISAKMNLLVDTIGHKQAYDNLIKHYKIWIKVGGLSWINYMNNLLELKETGSWVKEVISAELKTATL
jgi:hypothetical protein